MRIISIFTFILGFLYTLVEGTPIGFRRNEHSLQDVEEVVERSNLNVERPRRFAMIYDDMEYEDYPYDYEMPSIARGGPFRPPPSVLKDRLDNWTTYRPRVTTPSFYQTQRYLGCLRKCILVSQGGSVVISTHEPIHPTQCHSLCK